MRTVTSINFIFFEAMYFPGYAVSCGNNIEVANSSIISLVLVEMKDAFMEFSYSECWVALCDGKIPRDRHKGRTMITELRLIKIKLINY